MPRRKQLEGGREGQRDRLDLLRPRLGTGRLVDRSLKELIGQRLKPRDLAKPRRFWRLPAGHIPTLRSPANS
jgi:hypothetical protein